MGKLAVLKFGQGSFDSGFPVTLRLGNEGEAATLELDGNLPAATALLELWQTWQFSYRSRGVQGGFRQLKAPKIQVTRQRFSLVAIAKDWVQEMNQWLNGSGPFQPIRDQLLKVISQGEEVRLLIQTEQLELWQLPWHLWDLLHDHPNVDVTFSLATFAKPEIQPQRSKSQVRILVLLGDSTNIDIQTDLTVLTELVPDAEIYMPTQVQREQLCHDLWQQSWDILFFAGHSSSQFNEGRFYLNPDIYLTIDDLCYALQRAIANGLQLAIFNSCDGLGLAHRLADLQLPAALVMREPIPDEAAQKFLHYFLESFAHSGRSLHLAVRDAREKLHAALDDKYPCASWLPLVYQSPVSPSLSWRSLIPSPPVATDPPTQPILLQPTRSQRSPKLKTVLMISMTVTCAVLGIRLQGSLEPLELKAFDHLMQQRSIEGADPRLLVIGVTASDVNEQLRHREAGKGSLSDDTLQKLLTALEKYHPRVIGFDILRDQPVTSGYPALKQRLASHTQPAIVGICQFQGRYEGSVAAPPEIALNRIGFNDVPQDKDKVTRLHLLSGQLSSSPCQASKSFGLQLALHFLGVQGIHPTKTSEGFLKLNQTIFKRLGKHTGGYQNNQWVDQEFDQVLINYRPYEKLTDIAETVSLKAILEEKVDPAKIKDKIILVGRIDTDFWLTPYRPWESSQDGTPGVYIQAQATSQILAAALDQRPLIWWLPTWLDGVWLLFWGILGGMIARYGTIGQINRTATIASLTSVAAILVYLCCLMAIQWAGWIPLVPTLISLGGSSLGVAIYQCRPKLGSRSLRQSDPSHKIS
ncbi:CHASE2 domain-containing protein [Pantanalinema rosaneae CENA516]|uniref:CHASE2 domain-containing protein n=1 Tax=Pantanalinema rosaneae TaxID=1620701 RepID=UPI003D6FA657